MDLYLPKRFGRITDHQSDSPQLGLLQGLTSRIPVSYDKKILKAEFTSEVNWATISQFSLHCLTRTIQSDLTRQGLPNKIWVRSVLAI